ncbi:MAG TPA: response regulator transcription factor [Coleofasciculaceae cyanobacterium]|jgi:DNA-binding NarL/FixJ family response regulator
MTNTAPIRILLVDDHPILRQGMKQLLEINAGFVVCGEAGNGEEAIVQALSQKPDIILMDINLPKVSGYESSRAILTAWPEAKILVLSNQDDPQVMKKCLDLPIKGFLLKDIRIEDLVTAIRDVRDGGRLELSEELAARLQSAHRSIADKGPDALTEREQEVLRALSKGYTNQKLAELLVVSPKTVQNHLYSIYQKIGVSSRSKAILWAIQSGL